MTAIVRLQGLPAVADSFDIRQFFYGLNIPRGGVYITGGKYGEAFIVFSSYEDANYAMSLTGLPLRNSFIYLSYTTEAEMRRALEIYRITPNELLGNNPHQPKPSYLYIHGMPQKSTKVDLREFFRGFKVVDVVFLKFVTGIRNGNAIVRFANVTDANEALRLDGVFLCGCPVTLKLSDEAEWKKNGGDMNIQPRERSPVRSPVRPPRYVRRRSRTRTRSRSPIRRERRRSPYIREFFVHLINVSYRAEKKDLKKLFFNLDMADNNITFLLDKDGKRTREAFVMFTTQKDYKRALNLNLESFKGHTLNILPISKRAMLQSIDRMKTRVTKDHPSSKKSPSRSSREPKKCIYLRNFASEVTKEDILKFFTNFSVKEGSVTLLSDKKGVCLGEALVDFSDEKEARKAEKLNHEKYEGTEILLSFVSEGQKKNLLKGGSVKDPEKAPSKSEEALVSQADEIPDDTVDYSQFIESNYDHTPLLDFTADVDVPLCFESEPAVVTPKPTFPVLKNIPADECWDKSTEVIDAPDIDEGDGEDLPEGMTQIFIRNLPVTVTDAEISDFFHDYKVSFVDLKNIETGVATVYMADAEAESAVETLNESEFGPNKVLLSLE